MQDIGERQSSFTQQAENGNGQLRIWVRSTYERPCMIDYLKAGWQVSLSVAIDYTYSNLPIDELDSLHHLRDGMPT